MRTEILGYMAVPTITQTAEKSATKPTEKRKIMDISIPIHILRKLLAVILMELGAISIPLAEGDCTAFVLVLFIAISMIFNNRKED